MQNAPFLVQNTTFGRPKTPFVRVKQASKVNSNTQNAQKPTIFIPKI